MQISSIFILTVLLSIQLNLVATTCPTLENCVNFFGTNYNLVKSKAVKLSSNVVPTFNQDPSPCCEDCSSVLNCGMYYYQFNNGFDAVCTTFQLPTNLTINYAYLAYLVRSGNALTCVGFVYSFIGFPNESN